MDSHLPHSQVVRNQRPALSAHAQYNRYLLPCPKCEQWANVSHFVLIPQARGAGRLTFDDQGLPVVPKIPTIKAECLNGHEFSGPVDAYEDGAVALFMGDVEAWCGPSAVERTEYGRSTRPTHTV